MTKISEEFELQRRIFSNEQKVQQSFSGTYHLEKGEIFCIKNFNLDEQVKNAFKERETLYSFESLTDDESIKAIFAIQYESFSKPSTILFQSFTPSRIINKSTFACFFSKNTFNHITKTGIIFARKLDAVYDYKTKSLYFYSYSTVRQFLDLDTYFHEATDADITDMFEQNNEIIKCNDINGLLTLCDNVSRKRFTQIKTSGILSNLKISKVKKEAKKLDIKIEFDENAILFPYPFTDIFAIAVEVSKRYYRLCKSYEMK